MPNEDLDLFYRDYRDAPSKDGMYSLISYVGSMSPKLSETIVLFRKGRWPSLDWHRPIGWRELTQTERNRYLKKEDS